MDAKNLRITWSPIRNLAAYIVKIDWRKPEASLTAQRPGSVSALAVPEGFLTFTTAAREGSPR